MSKEIDDDEKPLDPAVARIQSRLRRLMIFGQATLWLGIGAVLLAIVYRLFIAGGANEDPGAAGAVVPTGEVTAADVGLPPEARLLSATVNGDTMVLAFEDGADTVTVLVDVTTMRVSGRFRVTGGTPAAPAPAVPVAP